MRKNAACQLHASVSGVESSPQAYVFQVVPSVQDPATPLLSSSAGMAAMPDARSLICKLPFSKPYLTAAVPQKHVVHSLSKPPIGISLACTIPGICVDEASATVNNG